MALTTKQKLTTSHRAGLKATAKTSHAVDGVAGVADGGAGTVVNRRIKPALQATRKTWPMTATGLVKPQLPGKQVLH